MVLRAAVSLTGGSRALRFVAVSTYLRFFMTIGGDYFDKRRSSTARQARLVAQLEAMGNKVIIEKAA